MPWWRELMGMGIVLAFGLSGALLFGALGLGVGFLLGVVVAANARMV